MSVLRLTRCWPFRSWFRSCLGQHPAEPQGMPIVNNTLPVAFICLEDAPEIDIEVGPRRLNGARTGNGHA